MKTTTTGRLIAVLFFFFYAMIGVSYFNNRSTLYLNLESNDEPINKLNLKHSVLSYNMSDDPRYEHACVCSLSVLYVK